MKMERTGSVITDLGGLDIANSVAIDPSGRIFVAGSYTDFNNKDNFALVAYKTDGVLDTTFGDEAANGQKKGSVITKLSEQNNFAGGVVIDPSGRILVAGSSDSDEATSSNFALVCYRTDGALDTTFGDTVPNGLIKTGSVITKIGSGLNDGRSVTVDSSGRILVAGYITYADTNNIRNFALVCYTAGGELDTTFGDAAAYDLKTGSVITNLSNGSCQGQSVAIDSSGRIFVAGFTRESIDSYKDNFALVCYRTDGALDTTFGDADAAANGLKKGSVITKLSEQDDYAYSVVIDSSDRVLVAGYTTGSDGNNINFILVRYTTDGALDTTFGDADAAANGLKKGSVITDLGGESEAFGVAIDSSGRILVAGSSDNEGNNFSNVTRNFALVCYTTDGKLDTTFGDAVQGRNGLKTGSVITNLGGSDIASSVAIDPTSGRILVAGVTVRLGNNNRSAFSNVINFALVGYTADGTLDLTFGDVLSDVICLVAGTPVTVDQTNQMQKGAAPVAVAIEHLRPGVHRIGGRAVVGVSQTRHNVGHLVCFEPHSLAINLPSARTVMTHIHHVAYKGRMVPAKDFVGRVKGVRQIPCAKGEWVYNVLLEGPQAGLMKVNNMVLETLDPQCRIATLLTNVSSSKLL